MEQRIVNIRFKKNLNYLPSELLKAHQEKKLIPVEALDINQGHIYVRYSTNNVYTHGAVLDDIEFENETDLDYLRSLKDIYAEKIANRKITLGLKRNILKETFPVYQSQGVLRIAGGEITVRKCCAVTKCTSEIKAYISKKQIDNFRFSMQLVKQWLEFLKGCEFGFDYTINENETFKEPNHDGSTTELSIGNVIYSLWTDQQIFTKTKKEDWFSVTIKGDFKHRNAFETYLNYMKFITLRYIYDACYFRIPVLAMQIKEALPNESNWQCLMLAHYYNNIEPYYALFNSGINQKNQEEPIKLVNPFTTFAKVSEKLDKGSMNNSFPIKLITDQNTKNLLLTFPQLFLEKKFDKVLEHLKKIFDNE